MASDLLTKDLITYDPLSVTTRKERTALLGISVLGVALVKVPLVPEKLAFLGVDFAKVQQEKFVSLFALIVIYYLAAFCIYAFTDYVAWRRQEVINLREYDEQQRARARESQQTISERVRSSKASSKTATQEPAYTGFASYWLAFGAARVRAAFEFLLPIGFALYAIAILIAYK